MRDTSRENATRVRLHGADWKCCVGLAVAYLIASAVGLTFRTEPEKFAIFWPPNGLLLGFLLVAETRVRHIAFLVTAVLCSLVANLGVGNSFWISVGFTLVNISEAGIAAHLALQYKPASQWLSGASDVFVLYAGAMMVCCVTAVPGAGVVYGLGATDFRAVWFAFWLADAMGIMLVTPFVLAWWPDVTSARLPTPNWPSAAQRWEAISLAALLTVGTLVLFADPAAKEHALLAFALPILPLLLWAGLRFGLRGTTLAILGVALVAIWNTGHGAGPFADPHVPATTRLLLVQLFLCVMSLSVLSLASALVERERSQQELRESEERYRQITETIEEIFWVTAPDRSRLHYASPAFERIWGRDLPPLYESPRQFHDSVHPEDRRLVDQLFSDSHNAPREIEFRIVRPDGSTRWLRSRAFPVLDELGKSIRLVGNTRDVTEQKHAELAQTQLIEELKTAMAEIQTLRGMIPICAWCKMIRNDDGFWQSIEVYLRDKTKAEFSHGICPTCMERQFAIQP